MKSQNQITILSSLENVYQACKGCELNFDNLLSIENDIHFISQYFNVNHETSIILGNMLILYIIDGDRFEVSDLAKHFNVDNVKAVKFAHVINYLKERKITQKYRRERFEINKTVYSCILTNRDLPEIFRHNQNTEITFHNFLGKLDELSKEKDNDEIDQYTFEDGLTQLIIDYQDLRLVKYAKDHLPLVDSCVFFDVMIDCISKVSNDFESSLDSTVNDFYDRKSEAFHYISSFLKNETPLNKLNLIEKDKSNFGNNHHIRLTDKTLEMLLEYENISFEVSDKQNKKLIYPENIQLKTLYYNDSEIDALKPFERNLGETEFANLQARLKENNMPTGLNILLYGAPGTGKTESVYQMAKKNGRAIFKVDISETKSMWFGESQKLIKKVFTDYYKMKKAEKLCPILLFNEADAVIGKRKNAGSSSVADTENAIQNILLEELENFDGILFATTNLVDNLDAAFERRFLFKVKFEAPSIKIAAKIWQNKLPILTSSEAMELAQSHQFSGGEMENIAKKCLMNNLLSGENASFESIKKFCDAEKWNAKQGNRIGF